MIDVACAGKQVIAAIRVEGKPGAGGMKAGRGAPTATRRRREGLEKADAHESDPRDAAEERPAKAKRARR